MKHSARKALSLILSLSALTAGTMSAGAASEAPWIIVPTGQSAAPFSEGFAPVGYYWRYLDRTGTELYPAESGDYPTRGVNAFSEGLARVQTTRNMPYSNFIDQNGNKLFPQDLRSAGEFSEGLAYATWDDFSGFIDPSGTPVFTLAEGLSLPQGTCFHEGLAVVANSDFTAYGYLDRTGTLALPLSSLAAGPFSGGLAAVKTADGLFGYIDHSGAFVIPPIYEQASTFSESRAWVKWNGQTGIIDEQGNFTPVVTEQTISPFDPLYETCFLGEISQAVFLEGFSVVRQGAYYGLIDRSGTYVIPPSFTEMGNIREGLFAGCKDGQWGLYDTTGTLVFAWDSIDSEQSQGSTSCLAAPSEGLFAAAVETDAGRLFGYLRSPLYQPSVWAEPEIEAAFLEGLFPHEINYHLQQGITRREFCVLLSETITELHITAFLPAPADTFCDTDDQAVRILASLGIVDGVGDGAFAPDATLTREQAATILVRAADFLELSYELGDLSIYTDAGEISEYAKPYVGALRSLSIMGGGDGIFAPKQALTREQAILTAYRLFNSV